MGEKVTVEIEMFARLREICGNEAKVALEVPSDATPEICFARMCERFPALRAQRATLAVAVNQEYASWDQLLQQGDLVLFVPPVSGGGPNA